MSTKKLKSPYPIAYEVGKNEYEVLPYLDLSRLDKVIGGELISSVIIGKKCGTISGFGLSKMTWNNTKAFVEGTTINRKMGQLPSKEAFQVPSPPSWWMFWKKPWSKRWWPLAKRAKLMNSFLLANGVDAEKIYDGFCWCEEYDSSYAYYCYLRDGNVSYKDKRISTNCDRLAVAF